MKSILSLITLLALSGSAFGGVDFYSNSAVTLTSSGFFKPIEVSPGNFSDTVKLQVDLTGSTIDFGTSSIQFGVTGVDDTLGTYDANLQPASVGDQISGSGNATLGTGGIKTQVDVYASGYEFSYTTGGSYFGWTATLGSDYYVGWAKFTVDPDVAFPTGITSITFNEWGYNTSTNPAGLTASVGDSTLNGGGSPPSPGVPEPPGLAILGVAGLILGVKRSRRS